MAIKHATVKAPGQKLFAVADWNAAHTFLQTDIDHNLITNTHNLTTDIDHNQLTNTHNLTTDISHDSIADVSADDHHAQSHTIVSHDTSATGAELDTLTDNSMADTLHRHSELSASDGTPDQALRLDATGKVFIGTNSFFTSALNIEGGTGLSQIDIRRTAGKELQIGANAVEGFASVIGDNPYKIYTNANPRLTILGDGKVGIKITAPTAALHIGDVRYLDKTPNVVGVQFGMDYWVVGTNYAVMILTGAKGGYIDFNMAADGTTYDMRIQHIIADIMDIKGGSLRIEKQLIVAGGGTNYISGDTNFDLDTLFVDASTNRVGILDTTPSYTLDVNGAIRGIDYYSGDGTKGMTGNRRFTDLVDKDHKVTIKDGLITEWLILG